MSEQYDKILLVDVDQSLLQPLGVYLHQAGYEVVLAKSGQEALEKAQTENPSLTILDLMLPDMAGAELCRRLRKAHLNMHVIILTSMDSTDDHIASLEAGADDYIVKPVNSKEFILRVRRVLQRSNRPEQPKLLPNREQIAGTLPQTNSLPDTADPYSRKAQTEPMKASSENLADQTLDQLLKLAGQAAQLQELPRAQELYLRVLELDSNNVTALIWLAWHPGDPYEGVRFLEKLVEKHPENVQLQKFLAAGKRRCQELDQLISGSGVLGYWNMAEQIHQERIQNGKDRRGAPVTPIGQLMLKKGFITAEQLETAVIVHEMFARLGEPKKLGEILLEYRYLTKEQLQEVLSEQMTDFNTQFY